MTLQSNPDPYGHFSADGSSYVCTTNETPKKWYNAHFSDVDHNAYYHIASNAGNGMTFARSADGHKNMFSDGKTRTVYLRDAASGSTWSPAGYPVPSAIEDYTCTYTLHDTTIASRCAGIAVSQRSFVPIGAMFDVTSITLRNDSEVARTIDVFAFAPITVSGFSGGNLRHQINEFVPELNGQYAQSVNPNKPTDFYNAFITSSEPVIASRGNHWDLFRGIWSSANPWLPEEFAPAHVPGHVDRLCFFIQNRVEIPAGESRTIHIAIGLAPNVTAAAKVKALMEDHAAVEAANQAVADEYAELCQGNRVNTGKPVFDAMMNHWLKKQMRSYLCYKNAYRDSLQIDMAYSIVDERRAIENAVDVIAHQYIDGHVPHSCRPLNPQHYSDKPTWLLMTFPLLVKTTGDFSILERQVPYLKLDGTPTPQTSTVWEHLVRTMRHLAMDTGANGLNIMHHADWNDGLTALTGKGESVLTSLLFCYGLREFAELAERFNEPRIAAEARGIYDSFKETINRVAWDGKWYLRGISEAGRAIGSESEEEGKIFLNPQTWAIISGVADDERKAIILAEVDQRLENPLGMQICDPLFTAYDSDVGFMSANPAGIAENGVYLHASGFKLVADALCGRHDEAWRLLGKILPNHADNPLEQSRNLPFAVTNSWRGAESNYGLTGSPWRTGTSGWVYQAVQEYLFGIRRDYDGLVVAPCLPADLPEVQLTRTFRGAEYHITIFNKKPGGSVRIVVDHQEISGNMLPLAAPGESQVVEVTIA